MKQINVVAAVIVKDNKIYATQRGYGEFKDYWEFPGGKVEPHESLEDALKREIKEELDTIVEVKELIKVIDYDYPSFHLHMSAYKCNIVEGNLTLLEAEDAKWLKRDELYSINWLPADLSLIDELVKILE
ncbi:MAG: (deoxy)nucleoside triphosphate pyrophosphohydrolase [Clostridia bacterium]|nr:(deoxy)nucleoside triphosphate pyrophosphohydrolase [Clostridia bacterium]